MKIFKLFSKLNSSGLSTGKMVGLAAALGAAGIGAFSLLSSDDSDQNTTFHNPYSQQEIVYVAGAAGGNWNGGVDGLMGETSDTSFQAVNSKAIQMQQREEARLAAEREAQDRFSAPEDLQAYSFSGSEGLGGHNNGKEELLASASFGGTDAAAGRMGSIQTALAQAQAQAQSQSHKSPKGKGGSAAGAAEGGSAQLLGAAESVGGLASRSVASVSGGGSVGSSWQQAGGSDGLPGSAPKPGFVPSAAGEGLDARAAHVGTGSGFNREKDAFVNRARRGINGNDLETMTKWSAAIARNKDNKANEGSKIFLANGQYSGGITVSDGATVSGGSAPPSDSFDTSSALGGLGEALDEIETEEESFKHDQHILRVKFWGEAAKVASMASFVIFPLMCSLLGIPLGIRKAKQWRKHVDNWITEWADAYDKKWGDRSTTGKQLAFSARHFIKPAVWMGPYSWLWIFTVMPWSLLKDYKVNIGDENVDAEVDYTTGGNAGSAEVGGDSLDLNADGTHAGSK